MNFKNEIWKTIFYIAGVLIVALATTAATDHIRINKLEVKQNIDSEMIKEIRSDVKKLIFYCGRR